MSLSLLQETEEVKVRVVEARWSVRYRVKRCGRNRRKMTFWDIAYLRAISISPSLADDSHEV